MIKQQVLARFYVVKWFARALVSAACFSTAAAPAADPPVADASAEEARIPFTGTLTFGVTINGAKVQSLWKREVMRQALLLAARTEMGYLPADNTLGDGVSRSKPSLELACTAGKPDRIQLLNGLSGKREVVWTQDFKFDSPWPPQRAWVERMELMSRTAFVEALQKAKYARRSAPRAKDSAAPLDTALCN